MCVLGFFWGRKVSRDWCMFLLGCRRSKLTVQKMTQAACSRSGGALTGRTQEKRGEERKRGEQMLQVEEVNWLRWGCHFSLLVTVRAREGRGKKQERVRGREGGGGEARWGMITPRQKGRTIETGNRVSVYPRAGRIFQNKTLEVDRLCLSMYASFYQMCQSYIRASMCRNA